MKFRRQIGCLGAVSCAAIAGCAQQVQPRTPLAYAGRQAASWDVVLPAPGSVDTEPGPEHARRDDALNPRDLAQVAAEPGPRLDRARRLFFRPRSDEIIYFRRRPAHRWWW